MNKCLLKIALAWAVLLVSASATAQEPGRPALFRQISVATGQVIALGEPFDPAGLAESAGEGVYSLRPGKFAGARKLLVVVSADSRVSAMRFIYQEDVSFDEVVGRYRTRFGQPHVLDDASQGVGVYWEDGRTRFEILRPSASEPAVSSRLLQQ